MIALKKNLVSVESEKARIWLNDFKDIANTAVPVILNFTPVGPAGAAAYSVAVNLAEAAGSAQQAVLARDMTQQAALAYYDFLFSGDSIAFCVDVKGKKFCQRREPNKSIHPSERQTSETQDKLP